MNENIELKTQQEIAKLRKLFNVSTTRVRRKFSTKLLKWAINYLIGESNANVENFPSRDILKRITIAVRYKLTHFLL